MKKVLLLTGALLLFVAGTVTMTSCGSDDETIKDELTEENVRDEEISTVDKSRNYLVGKWQLVKYGGRDMMNDSTFFHFTEEGKMIQNYRIGQPDNYQREYSYLVVDAWISSETPYILKGHLLCKGWLYTDTLSFSLNNDNLVLAPKEDPGVKYVMDPNYYFNKANY
jgi:hypothetical protein